jgi:hypothetical protein
LTAMRTVATALPLGVNRRSGRTSEDHRHMRAWSTVLGLVRAVPCGPEPEIM